jgi:hypothetical protein
VAAAGCTRQLPPSRPAASLYRDIERLVTLAEATGWRIDRLEVDQLLPAVLESTCRTTRSARAAALSWIDSEIGAAGGPVEEAYVARGRKLSRIDRLLTLTRIRLALERAIAAADEDCPFWLEPSDGFRGRQISDSRWQLTGGGGGKIMLASRAGDTDVRFGGAGRLLIGRTFGSRAGFYTGLDVGGSGSFPRDEEGDRDQLVLAADIVAPIVCRHTLVNSYFELEAGWLGRSSEEDFSDFDHGVHFGAAFGARALRTRIVFPGAAFGISWERTFQAGDDVTLLKVGARVMFDLDL